MTVGDVSPGAWLELWLSPPRLRPYLEAAAGDRGLALDLYEWNTTMAAAVLHDLAHIEVALRNAYDRAWAGVRAPGPHWTSEPLRYFPVLRRTARDGSVRDFNERPRKLIADAILKAGGPQAAGGKVVAELMFGFWRYLSSRNHAQTLWVPILWRGFEPGTSRDDVDRPVGRLYDLRNRVAHHEPLLRADLAARADDIAGLARLISPDLEEYVLAASTWRIVLAQRPC